MKLNEISEAMIVAATVAAWAREGMSPAVGKAARVPCPKAEDYATEAGFLLEGAHRLLTCNDPRGAAELVNDASAALLLARAQLAGCIPAGAVGS